MRLNLNRGFRFRNVRIENNKFFSDITNGEFVSYGNRKGLIVNNPWRSVAKKGESEIGFAYLSIGNYFPGKFTYASGRLLNKDELDSLKASDLQIMRNEIYARYGYIFKLDGEMYKYFKTQQWYHGQHQDVTRFITGLEKQNIRLIQMIEKNKNGL